MFILPQSAPPAAGGGAWSIAGSWDWSTNVANVDFKNLGGYSDLMVIVRNVTKSSAGILCTRASVDNGASFYSSSGDYVGISSSGVEANDTVWTAIHGTNTTGPSTGISSHPAAGLNGIPKWGQSALLGNNLLFVASTLPVNALRIFNLAGGNLTGGSIRVMGR